MNREEAAMDTTNAILSRMVNMREWIRDAADNERRLWQHVNRLWDERDAAIHEVRQSAIKFLRANLDRLEANKAYCIATSMCASRDLQDTLIVELNQALRAERDRTQEVEQERDAAHWLLRECLHAIAPTADDAEEAATVPLNDVPAMIAEAVDAIRSRCEELERELSRLQGVVCEEDYAAIDEILADTTEERKAEIERLKEARKIRPETWHAPCIGDNPAETEQSRTVDDLLREVQEQAAKLNAADERRVDEAMQKGGER